MGKKSRRTVTDLAFTIVYIISLLGFIAVGIHAALNGNIQGYFDKVTSSGKICGVGGDLKKPNLYFISYLTIQGVLGFFTSLQLDSSIVRSPSICVEKCPTFFGHPNKQNHTCLDNITINTEDDLKRYINSGACTPFNLPTVSLNGYCIPDIQGIVTQQNYTQLLFEITGNNTFLNDLINLNQLAQYINYVSQTFADVGKLKYHTILFVFFALVLCILLIAIFSFALYYFILVATILNTLASLTLTALATTLYLDPKNPIFNHAIILSIKEQAETFLKIQSNKDYMIVAIISGIIFGILLLICCYLFSKSVSIVYACTQEARRAFTNVIMSVFIVFINFFVHIAYIVVLVILLLSLMSIKTSQFRFLKFESGQFVVGDLCTFNDTTHVLNDACQYYASNFKKINLGLMGFVGFVVVWGEFLTYGITVYIIAYSFYNYYKRSKSSNFTILFFTLLRAVQALIIFNFGSIACGSFILTVVFIIQIILEVVLRMLDLRNENKIVVLARYLKTALRWIEGVLMKISSNAYIQVAISSHNFVTSCIDVFSIFLQYPAVSILIEVFGWIFMFLICVLNGLLTGASTYYYTVYMNLKVQAPIGVAVFCGLGSILVSLPFTSMYMVGVTSIHYCVCYDIKHPAGEDSKGLAIPEELKIAYNV